MTATPPHAEESPFALDAPIDLFPRSTAPAASQGPQRAKKRGKGYLLRGSDRDLVRWLTLVRFATRPQIQQRFYPLDAMPTRQAVANRLATLQQQGWIERHEGIGRYPVYQPTLRGYHEVGEDTRFLPAPSPGTTLHSLALTDLIVELETGRQELPPGYPHEVTVLTERQITHADKAPPKMRKRRKPPEGHAPGGEIVAPGQDVGEYHPVYGYLSNDGQRRGFPDALVLPVPPDQWEAGQPVVDAIAVEMERSEKPIADYRVILGAYWETTWRTAPTEAFAAVRAAIANLTPEQAQDQARPRQRPEGGRYRHVLYVCATQRIQALVEQAARDLRLTGFVLTMLAPPPQYNRAPERTTERWPAGKRRPRADTPVEQQLGRLPKRDLIAYLVEMGLADAALEALTPADPSLEAA